MNASSTAHSSRSRSSAAQATRHVYDVLVLGAQLAGTITACLLAKRGYRVLHVDPEGLGASYEDQGYQLPWAPSLLPSFKVMPQAEAALEELGVAVHFNRALDAVDGELQLLFPRHRLDFPTEPSRRAGEIGREFAAAKGQILSAVDSAARLSEQADPFFRQQLPFPPEGFFERWAVKKAARHAPAVSEDDEAIRALGEEGFGEALRALSRFLIYLDDAEAGALARLRPLGQLLRGARRHPGGSAGLRDALRARLIELGGDVVGGEGDPATLEELLFDGSQLSGVKLASSKNVFRARYVVAAMDVGALAPLIPPKTKKKGLGELLESVRARRFLFPVNLVMRDTGLPLGLKELALLLPGAEELGPVLLEVAPARKNGKEVAGEKVLCAAAFVPSSEHDANEERLRELQRRIETAVLELAPFAEPHVVARSAPFLDARNARGHRLSPHPLIEVGEEHFLGVAGLPNRTSCKNLFLASREVLPGLGLEGEFMAGVRAASLVQELLKKHDPLK